MKIQITKVPNKMADGGWLSHTHGSDFDSGLDFVAEGNSHENNPYGGVMVGQDESGVPNLVEEGEYIWNGDYVFSRRMKVPKKLRDKYKLSDDATFADAIAKLTKDSEERPLSNIDRATNDHILGEFADSQEELRMAKAQRAMDKEIQLQDDFLTGFQFGLGGHMSPIGIIPDADNISPFEKAEKLFADGGGIHIDPSKKGTFKAQASKMGMGVQEAASHILANKEDYSPAMVKKAVFAHNFAHADGGFLNEPFLEANTFDYGGALKWLQEHYPNVGNKEAIARVLDKRAKVVGYRGTNTNDKVYGYQDAFDAMQAGNKPIDESNEKLFESLVKDGMPRKVAFGLAYPQTLSYPYAGDNYGSKHSAAREAAYNKLIRNYTAQVPTSNRGNNTRGRSTQASSTAAKPASNNKATNAPFGDFGQMMDTFGTSFTPTFSLTQPTDIATNRGTDKEGKAAVTETSAITPEETGAASTRRGSQGTSRERGNGSGTATRNRGSVVPFAYDWYRNGSDGIGTPTGFKVGKNGKAYDYTPEYKALVASLGADDIRKWAAEHPDDPSLKSFLAKGNDLSKLTDEQWRIGATDGKYGFMHHVANSMLGGTDEFEEVTEPVATRATEDPEWAVDFGDPEVMRNIEAGLNPDGTPTSNAGTTRSGFKPKQTWTRYAPMVMSGLMGLKEMLTPADYGNANMLLDAAYQAGAPVSVGTEYIGDYRKRDPFDERYLMNIINQRGSATNRNMMNLSGGNRAVAMSGILANDLTTQMALAEAARQAYLANRADDAQVAEFNRGTNQFNATAQNTRNLSLAQLNSGRQHAMLSGIAQGARLRQAIKDQRDAAISANLTNFAQGLGDLGKENGYYNMLGGLNEEGVLKYFYGDDWKTKFNNVNV